MADNILALQWNSMQKIDLITSLPSRLACIILQDWLSLKSVIRLDTSYCSAVRRQSFVDLLLSDEYFIHETVTIKSKSIALSGSAGFFRKVGDKIRSIYFSSNIPTEAATLVTSLCHNLTYILFNNCTPELWTLLQKNEHLESLQLHPCQISGEVPFDPVFAGMRLPKLRELSLTQTTVSEAHIVDIGNMSSLIVTLELSYCRISPHALKLIPQMCPQLRALGLSRTGLNDACLSLITSSCLNIAHLDLSGNEEITDGGMLGVARNLKQLQSLNVLDIDALTDASLVHLYTHCANTLHTLHLYSVGGFGEAFDTLLAKCTKLRTLHYGDEHLDALNPTVTLPNSLHNLTTLVLYDCAISEVNLAQVGRCAVNVEVLSIYASGRYSSANLLDIFTNCTKLKGLHVDLENVDDVEIRNTDAFAILALQLWKIMRPGLKINHFPPYDLEYDVLKM